MKKKIRMWGWTEMVFVKGRKDNKRRIFRHWLENKKTNKKTLKDKENFSLLQWASFRVVVPYGFQSYHQATFKQQFRCSSPPRNKVFFSFSFLLMRPLNFKDLLMNEEEKPRKKWKRKEKVYENKKKLTTYVYLGSILQWWLLNSWAFKKASEEVSWFFIILDPWPTN